MIAWKIEGLDGGFVTGATGFAESSEKTYETRFANERFVDFSCHVFLVSLERRSSECD